MEKSQSVPRSGIMLATADAQVRLLEERKCGIMPFIRKIAESENKPLTAAGIDILQINIGYTCNLLCRHCHVNAGPDRKEMMSRQTMQECLDALENSSIKTIDITGGAPEMNPEFRWFIERIKETVADATILVRTNLTLLTGNAKHQDLPEFFKRHQVTLIASLPCYIEKDVDYMRGAGVFKRSIKALKVLNSLGYGKDESSLELNLVFNPEGPSLPGEQHQLEQTYRKRLLEEHNIHFSHLYTITNMPISRFLNDLIENGNYCEYMRLLADNYNALAVKNLMCRTTLSVGWDGTLYDCDFNQMLHLPTAKPAPQHISKFSEEALHSRRITLGQHCYGCTAGAGSSCHGSLI
jgi:radical SAM/Cys-rich protein